MMTIRLYNIFCFIGSMNDDYTIISSLVFYRQYE